MANTNTYDNKNEAVHFMSFNDDNINLGRELYFGTGAGKKMMRCLSKAKIARIMSPFLPVVSNNPESLFQKLLYAMRQNKELQVAFVTRKDNNQIEFIKNLVNALNSNGNNKVSDKKQQGFFQKLFDRQKEKEELDIDFRSDRLRCFFMDDYKLDPNKKPYSLHAKLYIIDDTDVYWGSYNFTDDGIFKNIESSMHTTDPTVIKRTTNYYNSIVDKCIPNSF